MRRSRRPVLVLLAAVVLLATACGGSDDGPAPPAGASATSTSSATGGRVVEGTTITIANFQFSPEILQVRVGETITVQNNDDADHTVTATDRSFDTGEIPTGTATFTVTRTGRFEYFCAIHPFMPHRVLQVVG